ncbi:MAG TPA: translocation/assembly module TamB [Bacteroidetes bacterium]|nr:translocation/assembly module TamB [Bacteroidota bacterium]
MADSPRPSDSDRDAAEAGAAEPQGAAAPQGDGSGPVPAGASRRSWGGRLARWAAGGLAGLAVFVVGVWAISQTEAARERLQGIAVQQIANLLAEDATVSVERLEGNFWTGARLLGLRVERYGETLATVDTVLVEYDLSTLLSRRFSASELYVGGPAVYVRQRADSTFNVAGLLRPADPDREGSGFVVEVDELGLQRGYAEVRWLNADRDSVHVVRDLALRASAFHSSEDSLVAAIDGLSLTALAPADPETGEPGGTMDIVAEGAFSRERLALRTLSIESEAGTDVRGDFVLQLPQEDDQSAIPAFTADLQASPFALADARAFAGLRLFGRPRVRLTADSDGQDIVFSLRGALDPESGSTAQPATVVLDGDLAVRPDGGPLSINVNGEFRRLNPATLLGNPALDATLAGTVSADVRGRSPEALTGPFELLLTDSRVGQRTIDRLRVDGEFRTGAVEFAADAAIPGLDGRVRGFARPFDRVPSLEATGTFSDLNLAALTGNPDRQARLRGDFAVEGRGTSLETVIGSAAVTLDEATYTLADGRTLRLSYADLDATLRGGAATFDADLALADGGALEAAGTAELGRQPARYAVSQGRFTNLDLAALTGNPDQASDLSGTFTLNGTGLVPESAQLAASVELAPSRLPVGQDGLDVAGARLDATLRGGTLGFDLAADLADAGQLTAAGTAQPFRQPLTYTAEGTFTRVDLAALTGNPDQASDLSGRYSVRGSGTDPQTLAASGTLTLDPGYVGARDIDGADLAFSLTRGDLVVDGTLDTPEGSFAFDVTGRPFDANPSFALGERTCFTGLDLGRLADLPDTYTDLNGCFRGSLTGFDPQTADGSGVVTLRSSFINAARVTDGEITFALNDGFVNAAVDLVFAADATGVEGEAARPGRLLAAFEGDLFADEPTYALSGRAEALNVNAILPSAPAQPLRLTADLSLEGRGLDPLTAVVEGEIVAEPSAVGFAQIEALDLDFALDRGTLRLDTLLLRSDIANLQGGGQIAVFDTTAATDFTLQGTAQDLSPLSAYVGRPVSARRVALDLRMTGPAGQPLTVDGTVEARTFAYGDVLLTGLDAELNATVAPRQLLEGSGLRVALDTRFDLLQTPAIQVQGGELTVGYDGEDVRLAGDVTVDGDRDIAFVTRVEIDPEPEVAPEAIGLMLERVDLRLGETQWGLALPSRILFGEVITVRGLLLQSDDGQQIAADGTLDFDGEQNFVLTAEEVDIGTVTDLAGLGSLGGTLSTTLLLSGPADAPLIDGTITLDELTSQGETFGALDAEISYAAGRLNLDATLSHRDGEDLFITGYIPQQISLAGGAPETKEAAGGVNLELSADAFPIAWAQPFLESRGYTEIGGTLRADVTVRGTRETPRLSGSAVLTDGRLGVASTEMVYEPLFADLTFEGDQILLNDVRIRDDGGETRLEVTGDVTLRQLSVGDLDLTIQPRGFVAIDTRTYDRLVLDRGSRPLRLTGTLQAPVLRGAVTLAEGNIYLTDELVPPELEPVELTAEQIRLVEARFGRRVTRRDTAVGRFTDALDYDLDVEIERNVWIRSEAGLPFDIEFSGNVEARKPAFADGSQLFGAIELVRGNVETLGKRFEVQRGRLTFNGDPLAAQVDLLAALEARLKQGSARTPIEIELRVAGRLNENPDIRLSSPQLSDPADIVSVIATGQLAGDLFGSSALTSAGTNLALGQITGIVEGVGQSFGLDLVEIDTDGSDLVIRVGKYLTSDLFTSVGYVVVPSATDRRVTDDTRFIANLDYELLEWLMAQGEYSGDRGVGGGLQFEIAW